MFDSLDDRIRHDAAIEKTPGERFWEATAIAVISVIGYLALLIVVRATG
jgi:hypothetical protein